MEPVVGVGGSVAGYRGTTTSRIREGLPLQDYLDRLEKESTIEALKKTRYNYTTAARLLGITVRSVRYRMERPGLNDGDG
jgi:two-component system response regulator PilR (NtrC family)